MLMPMEFEFICYFGVLIILVLNQPLSTMLMNAVGKRIFTVFKQ